MPCRCGDDDCMYAAMGYPWCRPCGEHHRPPECAIDEQGRSLSPCGHAWEEAEGPGHEFGCPTLYPEFYVSEVTPGPSRPAPIPPGDCRPTPRS